MNIAQLDISKLLFTEAEQRLLAMILTDVIRDIKTVKPEKNYWTYIPGANYNLLFRNKTRDKDQIVLKKIFFAVATILRRAGFTVDVILESEKLLIGLPEFMFHPYGAERLDALQYGLPGEKIKFKELCERS